MSKYSLDDLIEIFSKKFINYKYAIDNYHSNKQKIKICCDEKHTFEMSVSQHLKGYGCPYCAGYKKTKDEILNELISTHNNRYSYPNFKYIKLDDMIEISCKEHGIFNQSIKLHRNGSNCPKCVNRHSPSNKEFVKKCLLIDSGLNYSQVNYINNKTKVNIICTHHGLISIIPDHISNHICKKCYSHAKRFNSFKEKAIKKYGNRYLYYNFIDNKTPLKIEDTQTGFIFNQTPLYHIKCNYFHNKRNVSDFISKSNEVHGDKYIYDKSIYVGNKDNISIICKTHGEFRQIVNNHLRGAGCPKCNRFNIKESSLFKFIKSNTQSAVETSNRTILNGKELDIYLPELNLAFEFNGLYWHSELHKDRRYHLEKTKLCADKGINLIHIWEDDWDNKVEICKSIILNKIGKSERIYARKCDIRIVDNKLVREFLDINHIQGFVGSKIKIGLYYNYELVSLMTFGNLRKSLGQTSKDGSYELLRFCNRLNTSVVGGASKLFKYFIKNYNPKEVISYSDSSRSDGNIYSNLGFSLSHQSVPNYYYIVDGVRKGRFNFRKDKLVKEGYDSSKTEIRIMSDRGYYRIFDCGSKKWLFDF